jgi:hypothetical protein
MSFHNCNNEVLFWNNLHNLWGVLTKYLVGVERGVLYRYFTKGYLASNTSPNTLSVLRCTYG